MLDRRAPLKIGLVWRVMRTLDGAALAQFCADPGSIPPPCAACVHKWRSKAIVLFSADAALKRKRLQESRIIGSSKLVLPRFILQITFCWNEKVNLR